MKILFVCLGNICRSPMAEAVLKRMIEEKGWSEKIEVDSAGTGASHQGESYDVRTVETLARHGIRLIGEARRLQRQDFEEYDLMVVMDRQNWQAVEAMKPGQSKAQIKMLMEYAGMDGVEEVPDPWYEGNFEKIYDLIEAGCRGLMSQLEKDLQLK